MLVGAICALATVGDAAFSAASSATSDASLVVQTENGAVQGGVALGVENFLDIPYAAPPVGELRWSPPQAPTHWSGTRQANGIR